MNLKHAEKIISAAIKKAEDLNIKVVISVVDSGGHLISLKRMDGAIFGSVDISKDKAYTAAAAMITTERLGELSQSGQPLFGLNTTNQCRYIIFGGGIPFFQNEILAGAIGVSGGSVEEDIAVASAGLMKFQTLMDGNK